MRTIKPFDINSMRVKASERIHRMFKGAPFIYVKYKDTFAEGYCQYKDGTTASFEVWYRDMIIKTNGDTDYSPHERALQYINSLPLEHWAS